MKGRYPASWRFTTRHGIMAVRKMHKILSACILLFCVFLTVSTKAAVELKGGIFLDGNTLEVRVKVFNDHFSSEISAVLFAIKHPSFSPAVFSEPSTPTPLSLELQTVQTVGSWTYRFYSWVGASYKPDWPANSEHVILRLTLNGAAVSDSFMLVNDEGLVNANDPNFYIETPNLGGWFSGLYHPAAALPLFAEQPAEYLEIRQPYPNPAKRHATVELALDVPEQIGIMLTDACGRISRPIRHHRLEAGVNLLPLDAAGLADGVYHVVVFAHGGAYVRRLRVLR